MDVPDQATARLGGEDLMHAMIYQSLEASGAGARGAWRMAVALALRPATTSSASEPWHEAIGQYRWALLASLVGERRAHVAALVMAASRGRIEQSLGPGVRAYVSAARVGHLWTYSRRRDRAATPYPARPVAGPGFIG